MTVSPFFAIATDLFEDLRYNAGANGLAAFADGKAAPLVHGNMVNQLADDLQVIAWHDHLHALGKTYCPGYICGPEEKLRPIPIEERGVTPALILGKDVDFSFEFGVRSNRLRRRDDLGLLL